MKSSTMKTLAVTFALAAVSATLSLGAEEPLIAVGGSSQINESLKREALASIQRGVNFLTDSQKQDGSWCGHPAITGLVCMALHNSGTKENSEIRKKAVERGREFILKFVQKDGSIWMAGAEKEYPNYTTAIALAALAIINNPSDENVMRAARKYLLSSQDSSGGIGYGSAGPGKPDLSNTQWALEALYLTEWLDKEPAAKSPDDAKKAELAWSNAVKFLSSCQHVPESNDQVWVVKDKSDPNYGGFVYKPDESKASLKFDDKQSLRSYGSMTYAGLKSMIYAKLSKDDQRVKAAVEWAGKNYNLDENPGMGPEGHYYYLQTFSKALSVLGTDTMKTDDGKEHPWKADLVKKILSLQKGNGSWFNEKSGRWMETIPELVTSYALMSLESAMGPELTK